jgi:hypothetical protein
VVSVQRIRQFPRLLLHIDLKFRAITIEYLILNSWTTLEIQSET